MKEILNHTLYDNYNWESQVQKYNYNKTHLAWEKNPIPEKITSQMVKQNDLVFNPILQRYNDKEYEKTLRQKEKSAIFSTIISNLDNQLKKEQTFNIINLQDRLKGFEKHPDYPLQKDLINKRKKICYYPKNYNILSNLPLSQHHFDKPENRPKCNNSEAQKRGRYVYNFGHEKDYDIISTKYKKYHDEKENIDKEIKKIQTAKIFYKNNDYNPVKGVYYNQAKEQEYQNKLKEEQKNWGKEKMKNMPKCAKGKSDIYNLISLKVVDPQEFNKILKEEKNKKKRYEIRNELEKYYREQNLKIQDNEENKINNKNSYLRYKEEDSRQYDIIDLKDRPFREHTKNMKKNKLEGWEKIVSGAGENNTFATKSIYKDPYDYSEAGYSYDNFKINRNKTLSSLPKIGDDKLFNQRKKISKCVSYKDIKKNTFQRKFLFDKEKFFKDPPKNVNVNDNKYETITGNKDYTGKEDEFKNNKEKNMRNLKKSDF